MENKDSIVQLYKKLYSENFTELEVLRKKEKMKVLIAITMIITLIAIVFFYKWGFIFLWLGVIVFIITFAIINSKNRGKNKVDYTSVFKEKIVAPIIQKAIPNSLYKPNEGISKEIYNKIVYKEWYDRYRSEDLIKASVLLKNGKEVNMQIAEVLTERETKDKDGDTSYVTVFSGMAGVVEMTKTIKTSVFIVKNGSVSKFNKKKVKLDSSSFEALFDVEADDSIMAMRILTADIMEKLEYLYAKLKIKFEFSIVNDKLYIKFHTGGMYEPSIFNKSLELQKLQKLYNTTTLITDVIKEMAMVIDEIHV